MAPLRGLLLAEGAAVEEARLARMTTLIHFGHAMRRR
jgi:hypothetical protein